MKKFSIPPTKTIFFTADLHIDHHNIIKYCKRPYKNVDEQTEDIINKWNSKIKDDDIVFVLGDFMFTRSSNSRIRMNDLMQRLKGEKHLIVGNHDSQMVKSCVYWKSVSDIAELQYDNRCIILCHYPMFSWNKMCHGSYMWHGHNHHTLGTANDVNPNHKTIWEAYKKLSIIDVGIDGYDYYPVGFYDIKHKMKERQKKYID